MGGFFFLRFICPSLLAPHAYGLLEGIQKTSSPISFNGIQTLSTISDPPTSTAQRQYILVGKVLQNLSNNMLPGAKEEYMSKLSEFITNNQDELQRFYDDLLVCLHLLLSSPYPSPCPRCLVFFRFPFYD